MITTKNLIDYIKHYEKEFDICGPREITNKKLVIEIKLTMDPNFNFENNIISINRYCKDPYDSINKCRNWPYLYITEISEQEADELYFLFKSIKNRVIKEEIENEILSI